MVQKEVVNFLDNFDKERNETYDVVFRAGLEGESDDKKLIFILGEQTIYNTNSNTKREISQNELLSGSIGNLLDIMVEKVYQNQKWKSSNLKGGDYSGPVEVNTAEVDVDSEMPALQAVYKRLTDLKNGGKVKLLIENKAEMISLDDAVKPNIGHLQIVEDDKVREDMYIVDIILGADSSGGYRA